LRFLEAKLIFPKFGLDKFCWELLLNLELELPFIDPPNEVLLILFKIPVLGD
jgi:hypothetical protein